MEGNIDQIGIAVGHADKTRLYDAVGLALSELQNSSAKGVKRLILISAGKDDDSSINEEVVLEEARKKGAVIDTIGWGSVSELGSRLLAGLAKDTNGRYLTDVPDALQLSHSLRTLLDPPHLNTAAVFFEYDPSEERHKATTAELEFVPDGKLVLIPIRDELVLPREGPLGGGLPYHPAIGAENVKEVILTWISIGLTGFLAAYTMTRILRKKKGKGKPEEQERVESNGEP